MSEKTPSLRHYEHIREILLSTFFYEPILMEIYMNINVVKTKKIYLMVYDLRGH